MKNKNLESTIRVLANQFAKTIMNTIAATPVTELEAFRQNSRRPQKERPRAKETTTLRDTITKRIFSRTDGSTTQVRRRGEHFQVKIEGTTFARKNPYQLQQFLRSQGFTQSNHA
jgi:hypothetical protein